MQMTLAQQVFLKNEIWMLSFGGAFQRNTIYKEGVHEKERKAFRELLQLYVEDKILPTYKNTLDDKNHGAMIVAITEHATLHKDVLNNDALNVGTAQKLLNLLLKYYWCLGWLPEPPHFPVDSQIQKNLPAASRKSWTSISSFNEYDAIIAAARQQLKKGETLAQWELNNFKRR